MIKNGELALVLGVDASGKSTFLNCLQDTLGYVALEPTSSDEARTFKAANQGKPLDMNFVHQRRNLFRNLNVSFDEQISLGLIGDNVATSGMRLVTDISHAVMGKIVGNEDVSLPDILADWEAENPVLPDRYVFIHAPMDVIRARIIERQECGTQGEELSGFNSLHFLTHYQDTLAAAAEMLSADHRVLTMNSSLQTSSEMLELFSA